MITRRTTQRQFLLLSSETTDRIIAYCLAWAAMRFSIELIAWTVMSNHYHAVIYDREGKLPRFLEHFHKMVARALNAHLKRSENLWSSGPTNVVHLATPEAVLDKVAYVLANPVKAHLVDSAYEWTGLSSLTHLDGASKSYDRPAYFRGGPNAPDSLELRAVAPTWIPELGSAKTWATRVRAEVAKRELAARKERRQKGIRVMGRAAARAVSPFDAPKTPALRGQLRPVVACHNKERMTEELAKLKDFYVAYRAALQEYVAGKRTAQFPAGTYKLRLWGASCLPPTTPLPRAA